MNVLVTNDDGIDAPGLRELVSALASRGHRVYIAAPTGNRSGTGKSVKIPARVEERSYPGAAMAWAIDSTPATAVLAALLHLLPSRPDLVLSGVNKGPNMGLDDIFTSGTVGAALEGAIHEIPSIAVSLATDRGSPESYRVAAVIGVIAGEVLAPTRAPVAVNINVPEDRILGVRVTRPARNRYRLKLRREGDTLSLEETGYRARYWDNSPGTDVEAVLSGYVSVTPLDPQGIYAYSKLADSIADSIRMRLNLLTHTR